MFTICTIVKGFASSEFNRIQRNAIRSWLQLKPTPEVILFGDDEPGAVEAATDLGVPIYPIERSGQGTPLIKSCFDQGESLARHDIRCYINADIIICRDFTNALTETAKRFDRFLLSARRWDLDVQQELCTFDHKLIEKCRTEGSLRHKGAIDIFCHRGVDWSEFPEMTPRGMWDNYLVYLALKQYAHFIDATPIATIIHQNHTLDKFTPERLPERQINKDLYAKAVPDGTVYGFNQACWALNRDGFKLTHYGKSRRYHRR